MIQIGPALIALVVTVAIASVGNAWVGDALKSWYPGLVKPRFQIPLWAFLSVGACVYSIEAIILYRLLTAIVSPEGQVISIIALIVVMIANEGWGVAFFGLRSTLAGFIGMVGFLAPLLILQVTLWVYDLRSGLLLFPYSLWVIGYDVLWSYALWKLNPTGQAAR